MRGAGVVGHDVEDDLSCARAVGSEGVVTGEDQSEAGGVRCPPVVLAPDVSHAVVEGVEVVSVVVREAERCGDVAVEIVFGGPVCGIDLGDLVAMGVQPGVVSSRTCGRQNSVTDVLISSRKARSWLRSVSGSKAAMAGEGNSDDISRVGDR